MKTTITRRKMMGMLAGTVPFLGVTRHLFGANSAGGKRMGICAYSYNIHFKAARDRFPKAPFKDALEFLEYCHQLGAGGVQVAVGSTDADYAARFRSKAESYQMYFEGQLSLPRNETDTARFESEVIASKDAGAEVVRAAMLGGRRYETFDSADAFRQFQENSWRSLTLAEPILKKRRVRLAIENHKDQLVPELLEMLKRMSSEYVGVCVDVGNNIALLEEPNEVVEALAPFAFSSHIKDMAVQEYEEGFLLSEVPLGEGFLDLKRIVALLRKANPTIQFSLEMITRDPLKIPCLTNKYWATMQSRPASYLAATLAMVRRNATKKPLPQTKGLEIEQQIALEDANVRTSLAFARRGLGL